MEDICLQCGDRGFVNAFVDCVKCLNYSVHRYCLDVIPETLDEFVPWVCDDCAIDPQNQDHDAIPSQTRAHERKECQIEEEMAEEGNLMKQSKLSNETLKIEKRRAKKSGVKKIEKSHPLRFKTDMTRLKVDTTLQDKVSEQKDDDKCISSKPSDPEHTLLSCDETPLSVCLKKKKKKKKKNKNKDKKKKKTSGNERPNLENQCGEMGTEDRNFSPSNDHIEDRESENSREKDSTENIGVLTAEPVVYPIWRGSFNISNKKHDELYEIVAHMSRKACPRACEAAEHLQTVLHLEMLQKSDVWPKSFQISEPSGDNIALYFFPSETRNERLFDHLVDKMMRKELALKAILQDAELLIFTSTELPILYWRFQGKYYLWGVFRGKQSTQPNSPPCRDESEVKTVSTEM